MNKTLSQFVLELISRELTNKEKNKSARKIVFLDNNNVIELPQQEKESFDVIKDEQVNMTSVEELRRIFSFNRFYGNADKDFKVLYVSCQGINMIETYATLNSENFNVNNRCLLQESYMAFYLRNVQFQKGSPYKWMNQSGVEKNFSFPVFFHIRQFYSSAIIENQLVFSHKETLEEYQSMKEFYSQNAVNNEHMCWRLAKVMLYMIGFFHQMGVASLNLKNTKNLMINFERFEFTREVKSRQRHKEDKPSVISKNEDAQDELLKISGNKELTICASDLSTFRCIGEGDWQEHLPKIDEYSIKLALLNTYEDVDINREVKNKNYGKAAQLLDTRCCLDLIAEMFDNCFPKESKVLMSWVKDKKEFPHCHLIADFMKFSQMNSKSARELFEESKKYVGAYEDHLHTKMDELKKTIRGNTKIRVSDWEKKN